MSLECLQRMSAYADGSNALIRELAAALNDVGRAVGPCPRLEALVNRAIDWLHEDPRREPGEGCGATGDMVPAPPAIDEADEGAAGDVHVLTGAGIVEVPYRSDAARASVMGEEAWK